MEQLVDIPNVSQLSDRVIRVLGQNPGPFTLQGSNTYVIGTGRSRLLLDTGEGAGAYRQILKDALDRAGVDHCTAILISHHHKDHVGGLSDVCSLFGAPPAVYKHPGEETRLPEGLVAHEATDRQVWHVSGATVQAIYTPGHTRDHLSFYLVEENAIFSGDTVLGQGTSVFTDLAAYLRSLELLRSINADTLYPAHGPDISGCERVKSRLDEYINHRLERENQILGGVKQAGDGPVSAMDIVRRLYDGHSNALYAAAEHVVRLHLAKLLAEGRVGAVSTDRWMAKI